MISLVNADSVNIPLADKSVQMIATSPPYWQLRQYGLSFWSGGNLDCDHLGPPKASGKSTLKNDGRPPDKVGQNDYERGAVTPYVGTCGKCGAVQIDKGLGLEKLHDCLGWARGENCGACYVCRMRLFGAECWRVLRDDGVMFLNLGDSYANNRGSPKQGETGQRADRTFTAVLQPKVSPGLKSKDLAGIPWRVALALQADGWYLRSDIIWCLSGGTWIYARTQKGDMPMMIRDAARLRPETVKLWNGQKWTQVLGWSKSERRGDEIELVLRSGERISCTPTHQFPTRRGLLAAGEIKPGDILLSTSLPEPDSAFQPLHIDLDAAWFVGLYLAEGSRSGDIIQIAGHTKETDRWERVQRVATAYGGNATRTIDGNKMSIRVSGKLLVALLDSFVSGRVAKDKCIAPIAWRYSNEWLRELLMGYLGGDGHYDQSNNRWRLGFTRNYNLERDLRVLAARLGLRLTLKMSTVRYDGRYVPTFKGELRFERTGHFNEKDMGEVVEIRKARCRYVYDVGVEDDPHLFALASGILTHNSKPNAMPESVTDRPTKAHEYIFLLAKSERYYYDADAIREPLAYPEDVNRPRNGAGANGVTGLSPTSTGGNPNGRNRRTVWSVNTTAFSGAHFACWPPDLVEPMIKAGTSERGGCPRCGAQWKRVTEKIGETHHTRRLKQGGKSSGNLITGHTEIHAPGLSHDLNSPPSQTVGWEPTCKCEWFEEVPIEEYPTVPAIVLDPFAGSGTTGIVARRLNRRFIGLDLSFDYLINQARTRLELDRLEAWGNGGIVTDDLDEIMTLPLFATNGRAKETL